MTTTPYTIPNQPQVEIDDALSDMESLFLAESPPGMWPENSDSNFGAFRRAICTPLADAVVDLNSLYQQLFISTVSAYMNRWEREMGLPEAPENLTLAQRRTRILSRIRKTPWTTGRIEALVEDFITATFGEVPSFGTEGISLAGGIPLHATPGDVSDLYTITYSPETFTVSIEIDDSIDIDVDGFSREMDWMTPAGMAWELT